MRTTTMRSAGDALRIVAGLLTATLGLRVLVGAGTGPHADGIAALFGVFFVLLGLMLVVNPQRQSP